MAKISKISKKIQLGKVTDYLKNNRLLALATVYNNRPWSVTVFYAYDKKMNLFFYSKEDTRHCRNIAGNSEVSVVINHSWQYPDGSIRGVQMTGRAHKVTKAEWSKSYKIYKARFKWADEFKSDHVLYTIKPKEIWYIDEKLFGHFYRERVL